MMNNYRMNIGNQPIIANQPQLSKIQKLQLFHQVQCQKDRDYQNKVQQKIQELQTKYRKTFGCNYDTYSQIQGILFEIY